MRVSTLIKWPGGKAREIKYIQSMIPPHKRYIEPFFGGGALYFYLRPQNAVINDISPDLMEFYALVKEQNESFRHFLMLFCELMEDMLAVCDDRSEAILSLYRRTRENNGAIDDDVASDLTAMTRMVLDSFTPAVQIELVLDPFAFRRRLYDNVADKMRRTVKNEKKAPFSDDDLRENLITGFMSGIYIYFRDVYNDILLGRSRSTGKGYRAAVFYFIREYCYGSMFRYNKNGEFNIPYGGMSYNRKDFRSKIGEIFHPDTAALFAHTALRCEDFGTFLSSVELNENDFMFLDPPYDTDFSDYEGVEFNRVDHQRLAEALRATKAKFILIIKNTDYIYSLYEGAFNILCFDKTYSYNVRSRNERSAEHLIVTNLEVE